MFRRHVRLSEASSRACQLVLEELEGRQLPSASLAQLPVDVVKFVSDLGAVAQATVQAGTQIATGLARHNAAEYYQGVREYNSAVGAVESDYQQLQNDLSLLNSVQAGISALPLGERMQGDVYAMLEGGLITAYGGLTLNRSTINEGINFAKGAASDYIAAIEQAFTNYSSGLWSSQDQTDSAWISGYGN